MEMTKTTTTFNNKSTSCWKKRVIAVICYFLVIPMVVAYCNQRRLDRIPGLLWRIYCMPTTQSTCTHARLSTAGINYAQRLPPRSRSLPFIVRIGTSRKRIWTIRMAGSTRYCINNCNWETSAWGREKVEDVKEYIIRPCMQSWFQELYKEMWNAKWVRALL